MSKTVQWKRGNTAQNSTYTGAQGEITVNTTNYTLVVHDGVTAGGYALPNYSNTNVAAYLTTYTGAISSMTGNLTTTANVQGAFIKGNGSQLTGITTNYSNANVAAYLVANPQSGTYSNANVSAYLVTSTGNINAGNLTVNNRPIKSLYTVQYLAVGGGGGGAGGKTSNGASPSTFGGAGGAGGLLAGVTQFTSNFTYIITVGSGGAGSNGETLNGLPGGPTSIFEPTTLCNVYAYGGGYGGGVGNVGGVGASGGGGGGASTYAAGGYAGGEKIQYFLSPYGLVSQGTAGNTGYQYSGVGTGTTAGGVGGGLNLTTTIGNVTSTYSVGGNNTGGSSGAPGTGNGGSGNIKSPSDGFSVQSLAGSGGSGIVYITYSSPTQLGTGGNVWSYTQNGYTYWMHQFTSNGTYIA